MYEEIFENPDTSKHIALLLRNSDLCGTIVNLAKRVTYTHESQKTFRQGYMAAVIKLGNIINKHAD